MSKCMLIIGTGDTKSEELMFMKQCLLDQGASVLVMDVGVLGDPDFEVAYTRHAVAEAANTTNQAIIELGDENKAMTKTAKGAAKLTRQIYDEGKIQGVIMLGGTMATDLSLDVAEALPFGFPKFIITTIAYSHLIPPERLSPDLMMILWSGGLYGLNSICKTTLSQACGAVLGAAKAVQVPTYSKPVVGMTSLGSSALKYMKFLKPELEKRGFELAVFHTTGQGGRAFEALSQKRRFVAVMDFSVQELVNEMCGSIVTSGKNRMENAGLAGIPQIIAPGAADLIDLASWKPLPEAYKSRPYHAHNRLIGSVTLTLDERKQAARLIGKKLAKAKGPVCCLMPMTGIDEWDREGNELHAPENLKAFAQELKNSIKPPVKFLEVDAHINDKAFSDKVLEIFDEWISKEIIKS